MLLGYSAIRAISAFHFPIRKELMYCHLTFYKSRYSSTPAYSVHADFLPPGHRRMRRRSREYYDSLLNNITREDVLLKAVHETSGGYCLWVVIVGKNALFPHHEESNSVPNNARVVPLSIANEVRPLTGIERELNQNRNPEGDRENIDGVETTIERAAGLAEQGTCGIGEETYRKDPPTISKSNGLEIPLRSACMVEISDHISHGVSAIPAAASLTFSQDIQSGNQKRGPCNPPPSVGTTVLDMMNTFDDLTSHNEVSSKETCNEQVGSYFVKPRYASVLGAILDKHGDIARYFPIKCSKMLTFVLEKICEAVQEFETVRFTSLRNSHLESLHSAITDAELVKRDVKWLRDRYEELVRAVDQIKEYKLNKSRKELNEIAEGKKRDISLKKTEMLKLQSEIEILEGEVVEVTEKSKSE